MIKKIILFTFLINTICSFSQKTSSSPYSFFGIGDQAKIKSVEEIGMGQIGGALNSEYHLSFTNPVNYYYDKSNIFAFGGFCTPKFNSIASYWDRVIYIGGFNYKNLGLVIDETAIEECGISFGASLPLGLRLSNANIGFEFEKRGTNKNGLIKENYYNFRLSLSLNDKMV